MGKDYIGTKFDTEFKCEKPLESELYAVIKKWASVFAEYQFAPALDGGFGGNLSIKDNDTFIITASGADLGNLSSKEIVRICDYDMNKNIVIASGCCIPSSESMLHAELYKSNPEINAVFHGHYPPFEENAEKLNLKITRKETPYGSKELISETLKISKNQKIVILKNHGFISLGSTPQKAGEQVLEIFRRI